ncbi:MAG TPA: hypothetical protein VLH85_08715 [Levilinea sp.]|nr:hypothetical protein [Levilinea sp.]
MLHLWRGLPDGVMLIARMARNRRCYGLPCVDAHPGAGRPAGCGERTTYPAGWLAYASLAASRI